MAVTESSYQEQPPQSDQHLTLGDYLLSHDAPTAVVYEKWPVVNMLLRTTTQTETESRILISKRQVINCCL